MPGRKRKRRDSYVPEPWVLENDEGELIEHLRHVPPVPLHYLRRDHHSAAYQDESRPQAPQGHGDLSQQVEDVRGVQVSVYHLNTYEIIYIKNNYSVT